MTEPSQAGGRSLADDFNWLDDHVVMWSVPSDGFAAEYIHLMFEEISEALTSHTNVGLLVDVRATDVPNSAGRAEIIAGVNTLSDMVCCVALIVGQSVAQKFIVQVSRFLMTGAPVPFRIFTDMDQAKTWIRTQRESD